MKESFCSDLDFFQHHLDLVSLTVNIVMCLTVSLTFWLDRYLVICCIPFDQASQIQKKY